MILTRRWCVLLSLDAKFLMPKKEALASVVRAVKRGILKEGFQQMMDIKLFKGSHLAKGERSNLKI